MNPDINLANTIVGAIIIPPDIDIISELFNSFICKILFVNIILTESIKYHT